MFYRDFIDKMHRIVAPMTYVEIGVGKGDVLRLAKCTAIGIDPAPQTPDDMEENIKIYPLASDDFFYRYSLNQQLGGMKIDFAFIDGWHNFEFSLRDFMNLEAASKFNTVIVVDDVKPRTAAEAGRTPTGGAWTGDVYKLYYCLKEYRKDLALCLVDTLPTGLMIVSNLNPDDSILKENYTYIENRYVHEYKDILPPPDHDRTFVSPDDGLDFVRRCRGDKARTDAPDAPTWQRLATPDPDDKSRIAKQEVRYAWWKPPERGIPADHCPVPFHDLQAVPGMEPWLLVHCLKPVPMTQLPVAMIAAQQAVRLLEGDEVREGIPARPANLSGPEDEEPLESDVKPRQS